MVSRAPTEAQESRQVSTKEEKSSAASGVFGAQFKPKTGSWECGGCYVRNDADVAACICCGTSKDGKTPGDTGSVFGQKSLGGGGLFGTKVCKVFLPSL